MKTFDASPRASLMIESLRDIGYSLETAIADVIDNSITANATEIQIFSQFDGEESAIGILDNGWGMSEDELREAMRPGSCNPLSERSGADLGRFGLGLKTASFSQARRLTVVSRKSGESTVAIWDLDHIASTDRWEVQAPETTDGIPWADDIGDQGTLVVWEKLDRLIESRGVESQKYFAQRLSDVCDHLSLVFHRFLTGKPWVQRKLLICMNYRPLKPFDPFHTNHSATQKSPEEKIGVANSTVTIRSFTLPHHSKVSQEDWTTFAGREGYVKNQGFYVYRANRLIIHGTWFNLARQSELTKLTRVSVDFSNDLDAEWKLDVKKASAQLPLPLRQHLRGLVERIGAGSKRAYRQRGAQRVDESRLPAWTRMQKNGTISYRLATDHPVLRGFAELLGPEAVVQFERLLEFIAASFPVDSLFADMGGETEKLAMGHASGETLRQAVEATYPRLLELVQDRSQARSMMRTVEPYASSWVAVEKIMNRLEEEMLAHD